MLFFTSNIFKGVFRQKINVQIIKSLLILLKYRLDGSWFTVNYTISAAQLYYNRYLLKVIGEKRNAGVRPAV